MRKLPFVCVAMAIALVVFNGWGRISSCSLAEQPNTLPTSRPEGQNDMKLRKVEVTLLGSLFDLKGMKWPKDPDGRWLSWSIEEPCELTVRLPSGKALEMRTRPILIVSRVMLSDVVGSVDAPPAGGRALLPDHAREVERLLARWHITPDDRMRKGLEEWKRDKGAGTGIGGQVRIGTDIDKQTQVCFRANSGGPEKGGWFLVVEFSANIYEMDRVAREAEALRDAATRPTPPPATQPSSK